MKSKTLYTVINVVSYVFLLTSSFLVDGSTAFSVEGVEPLISPAPYAFSIWGFIYLLFGIWILKFGFKSTKDDQAYLKVSRFFPIALACSGGSLLVGQPVAAVLIIASLISAVLMYLSFKHAASPSFFFKLPISVYLGWISIATIVDISIVLKSSGLSNLFGLPELFWSVFILMFAGFIAIYFLAQEREVIYPLVFVWAYIAIAIENLNNTPIFVTCCGVILLIGLMMDRVKRTVVS